MIIIYTTKLHIVAKLDFNFIYITIKKNKQKILNIPKICQLTKII